jgi:hypoxanthine phosphoribosyltransferase
MTAITPEQALAVLRQADELWSPAVVGQVLDQLATAITERLAHTNPLLLAVMHGGVFPAVHLSNRLQFPFEFSYLHATRYQGGTRGGTLHWLARSYLPVVGRTVLVVDDIFDEGLTLQAILDDLRQAGAAAIYSAVLVNKQHDRKVPGLTVDFVGLPVPDRYVFGYGMDYHEYWRNLPAIYAVADEEG